MSPPLTPCQLAVLDVIVSYHRLPERLYVSDLSEEVGIAESTARRALSRLRREGLVWPFTARLTPEAWTIPVTPHVRRMLKWIDESVAAGRRVTYIDLAREFRTGSNSASVRLTEMRKAGLLEPRCSLWPTDAGVALAHARRAA